MVHELVDFPAKSVCALTQVGKLGWGYSRWLHAPEPVVRPRFFANPLLEAVTATEWWKTHYRPKAIIIKIYRAFTF